MLACARLCYGDPQIHKHKRPLGLRGWWCLARRREQMSDDCDLEDEDVEVLADEQSKSLTRTNARERLEEWKRRKAFLLPLPPSPFPKGKPRINALFARGHEDSSTVEKVPSTGRWCWCRDLLLVPRCPSKR